MNLIATCIFSWNGYERRSNRYGAIMLSDSSYGGLHTSLYAVNPSAISSYLGKRVRLVAEVVENRESGHIGDIFLGLYPVPAQKGVKIEVGIGFLSELEPINGLPQLALNPSDGRGEFWCDPRAFYQLHDQTVNLYVEETNDPVPAIYKPNDTSTETAVVAEKALGSVTLQVKSKSDEPARIEPRIEGLGGGLYSVTPPGGAVGSRFPVGKK